MFAGVVVSPRNPMYTSLILSKGLKMGPLEGIKVLDLSLYGPGRYCSMILADLGAEVITVEIPRSAGKMFGMMTSDTEAHYIGLNRNKKCPRSNSPFCKLVPDSFREGDTGGFPPQIFPPLAGGS